MKYYINMGRWASEMIGPFDDARLDGQGKEVAEAYIDKMDWRGKRPTVVTRRLPDLQTYQDAIYEKLV